MAITRSDIRTSYLLDGISTWLGRGLESLWLLAAVLVPLAFIDPDYAVSEAVIAYVEVPKVALLRTLAGLMLILWLTDWAIQGKFNFAPSLQHVRSWPRLSSWLPWLAGWLRARPARGLTLAVWFFAVTTLLSTVFSASMKTSLWGEIPGQDGYSTYTVAAYVTLFGVISTCLKTRRQLWRLLGAVVIMGVLVAGYGVLQHYDHDFLNLTESTGGGTRRVTSFMGNTIFAAAVMSMTIPVSLAVAAASLRHHVWSETRTGITRGQWMSSFIATSLWSAVLAIQLLGILFTFSRGAWVGSVVALAGFFGLMLVLTGFRNFSRSAMVFGLSGALAVAFLLWQGNVDLLSQGRLLGGVIVLASFLVIGSVLVNWRVIGRTFLALGLVVVVAGGAIVGLLLWKGEIDVPGGPAVESTSAIVGQRFTSIGIDVLSGFGGGRGTHWKVSWELIRERPWFEYEDLPLRQLRPIVGYGPDLFRYTYLLKSPAEGGGLKPLEPDHAHNFFIHQTVEQGYLGMLSSLGIFTTTLAIGGYILFRIRRNKPTDFYILLIGLLATVAGRFAEMIVGVARVSDLTILWILLAALAVVARVVWDPEGLDESEPVQTPSRRNRGSGNRRRNPSRPSAHVNDRQRFWRLATVAWLVGSILVLTWVKSINYVRAAVAEGQAAQNFWRGDWQTSLEFLNKANDLAPDVPSYHNNRALLYLAYQINSNRTSERECSSQSDVPYLTCLGLQSLQSNLEAVNQSPYYYRSMIALGDSAFNLNLNADAVRYYGQSLAMVPDNWRLANEIGNLYIKSDQPEAALAILEDSLAITKGNKLSARALVLQGVAYEKLGDLEKSIELLRKGLGLDYGASWIRPSFLRLLEEINTKLDTATTIEYFDGLISENDSDAISFYNRGRLHSRDGNLGQAIDDFNRSIQLKLGLAEVYAERAAALTDHGPDNLRAKWDLIRIVEAEPENPRYRALLGNYFRAHRLLGQAERELDQAIALDPELALAYSLRGRLFNDLGQYQRAIQDLDEAIRLDPDQAEAYNQRGFSHLSLGEIQDALQDLDQAVLLDPILAEAYTNRGLAYTGLGQRRRALQDYRASLDISETRQESLRFRLASSRTLYLQGAAYHGLGLLEQSAGSLEQSLTINTSAPWSDQALSVLAGVYRDPATPISLDHYSELIAQDAANPVAYFGRGHAYHRLGLLEDAVEDFGLTINRGLAVAEAYATLGAELLTLGSPDLARKHLIRAAEAEPKNARFRALLGNYFGTRGLVEEAERELDQAILLDPELALAYSERAMLFISLGRNEEAQRDIDQALKLGVDPALFPVVSPTGRNK